MDLASIKAQCKYVPGIDTLTITNIAGRFVAGFNGLVVGVDPRSTDEEIAAAIRKASQMRADGRIAQVDAATAPIPTPRPSPTPPLQPKDTTMSSVTGARSASQSLKQMMEQAKQSVADGMAQVQTGIAKHAKAGEALKNLGGSLNKDGDDLLATVGQFTNDLGSSDDAPHS